MRVYLLKDVEKVGIAGEMIKASDGFAKNFLIPHGFGIQITPANSSIYEKKALEVKNRKQVIESKTSMLAEKIRSISLVMKRKMHDDTKLYGAVSAGDMVDALAAEGIKISKNQVLFDKTIKEKGVHEVTIKLSNSLMPKCVLKIIPE